VTYAFYGGTTGWGMAGGGCHAAAESGGGAGLATARRRHHGGARPTAAGSGRRHACAWPGAETGEGELAVSWGPGNSVGRWRFNLFQIQIQKWFQIKIQIISNFD
jgi:hypothetical protein